MLLKKLQKEKGFAYFFYLLHPVQEYATAIQQKKLAVTMLPLQDIHGYPLPETAINMEWRLGKKKSIDKSNWVFFSLT